MKLTAYDMAQNKSEFLEKIIEKTHPTQVQQRSKKAVTPDRGMLHDIKTMKVKDLCKKYRISHTTATRLRADAGVKVNIEWTDEKINVIETMLENGFSNKAVGRHFGVAGTTIIELLKRKNKMPMKAAYAAGEKARLSGKTTDDCPYSVRRMELRHHWLAGWHDRDMKK